jgi:hypothetical protein
MPRSLLILALAVTLSTASLALTLPPAPPAAHAQSPSISVTPAGGSQFDTFTFVGSGFAPGTELAEAYVSPDGESFTFVINGQPAVVVADADGNFTVEVRPSVDFQGAREGTWGVAFCVVGGSDCWTATIDISA